MKFKSIALAAATALVAGSALLGSTGVAHARPMTQDPVPCAVADVNCYPGGGWTRILLEHVSSGLCVGDDGANLDVLYTVSCSGGNFSRIWWTRALSGSEIQFTQEGNDGYFHDLGYSGGKWKLEPPSDGIYLVPWDSSSGAWSYTDSANPGDFFMGDPGTNNSFLLEALGPLTHWLSNPA